MSGLPALDAVITASSHSALQGQHDHAGEDELETHINIMIVMVS